MHSSRAPSSCPMKQWDTNRLARAFSEHSVPPSCPDECGFEAVRRQGFESFRSGHGHGDKGVCLWSGVALTIHRTNTASILPEPEPRKTEETPRRPAKACRLAEHRRVPQQTPMRNRGWYEMYLCMNRRPPSWNRCFRGIVITGRRRSSVVTGQRAYQDCTPRGLFWRRT